MKSRCKTEPLVVSEACEVHLCPDCETVHLSMGPVSLRLRERHFKEVANNLRKALFELQKIRSPEDFIVNDVEKVTRLHSVSEK